MSRTDEYTAEEVIAAIRQGHTAMGAAKFLGCWPETVRRYAKKYPTVARALQQERIGLRDLGELSLRQRIVLGEGWAVMGVFKLFDEDGNAIPQNKIEVDQNVHGELVVKGYITVTPDDWDSDQDTTDRNL